MKTFTQWLENKKINEVSSDLLRKAASSAMNRKDPRGDRMAFSFVNTAKRREKEGTFRSGKPLNKDSFNVTFYYEQDGQNRDNSTIGNIGRTGLGQSMTKPIDLLVTKMEYKKPIMIEGLSKEFGRVFISIEENRKPLKIRASSTFGKSFLQDNTPLFLDRNGARILAEKLTELKSNSNPWTASEIEEKELFKPTDFPLI